MEIFSFSQFIRLNRKAIVTTVLATSIVGCIALLILIFGVQRKYTSEVQILVIQKYTLTDSYTAAKSAEKVSKNLAEVIKTSVFLNDVVATQSVDLSDILRLSEEDKRKAWSKKIGTDIDDNAPIIKITAYDPDQLRAERIATTVAQVLIDKGGEYHGAPDTISLKIVDTALTSEKAKSPSIPLYTAAAMMLTVFLLTIFYLLRATGSWLEPVSVVPSALVRTTAEMAAQAPQPQKDLNIKNFSQRLSAHDPKEKSAYLRGDIKTMHDNKK